MATVARREESNGARAFRRFCIGAIVVAAAFVWHVRAEAREANWDVAKLERVFVTSDGGIRLSRLGFDEPRDVDWREFRRAIRQQHQESIDVECDQHATWEDLEAVLDECREASRRPELTIRTDGVTTLTLGRLSLRRRIRAMDEEPDPDDESDSRWGRIGLGIHRADDGKTMCRIADGERFSFQDLEARLNKWRDARGGYSYLVTVLAPNPDVSARSVGIVWSKLKEMRRYGVRLLVRETRNTRAGR